MPMSRHRSLAGLLLALLFVGGNFGLPVADALIFHARPVPSTSQKASLSNPGGEAGHQQLCLQLKAAGQARSIPGSGTPAAPASADPIGRVIPVSSTVATSPDPSFHFSRAPPSEPARG